MSAVERMQAFRPAATAATSRIPFDLAATRAALAEVTARTADLVAGIDDPGGPTSGLTWTLGETAAHILIALRGFTDAVAGGADAWTPLVPPAWAYPERMAAMTARTLEEEPTRDPATLGRLIRAAAAAFLEASAGRSGDEPVPTPWYGAGRSLPLGAATALLLGEQLVHGWDLARTMRKPWPIERRLALLALPASLTMMPIVLNPDMAEGVTAVYALHVRRGPAFALTVSNGTISVVPRRDCTRRIDCHLSADPVALLLFGYGRLGLWPAIARGRLIAWGIKPWLGFRMGSLFFNP